MILKETTPIQFHYLVPPFYFQKRSALKAFILKILKKKKVHVGHIDIIFCSDDYLFEINQKHLKHSTLTDIITFPLSKSGERLEAEIYISIQRVRENARFYEQSFQKELHRVVFHGILHLCGFEDKTVAQAKLMRKKEEFYLSKYGFT